MRRRRDELLCSMLAAVVGLLRRGFEQLQQLLRYLPHRGYDLDGGLWWRRIGELLELCFLFPFFLTQPLLLYTLSFYFSLPLSISEFLGGAERCLCWLALGDSPAVEGCCTSGCRR